MPKIDQAALVDKIIKYTAFLNEHGYVVSKGRSSSPQLKKAVKPKK